MLSFMTTGHALQAPYAPNLLECTIESYLDLPVAASLAYETSKLAGASRPFQKAVCPLRVRASEYTPAKQQSCEQHVAHEIRAASRGCFPTKIH